MTSVRAALLAAALAAALAPPPAAAGDVVGSVRYTGAAPAAPPLPVTKDHEACGDGQPDESLVADAGRLSNVVVSVQGAAGARQQPARLVLDQRRCRFAPRVQVAPLGSTLEILNSDPILHNVHGWNGRATAFNVPLPTQGQRVPKTLSKAGLVRVGCDVHSWMAAFVYVADGPAAVSGADGTFRLTGLPPGAYTVTAWHERLGERAAQVTVPASGDAKLEFSFGG